MSPIYSSLVCVSPLLAPAIVSILDIPVKRNCPCTFCTIISSYLRAKLKLLNLKNIYI